MQAEDAIGAVGAVFLAAGGLMMLVSVRRGRELCRRFAERHPERYAELGRPLPGYFDSLRRSAYLRFIHQRGFSDLGDPLLVDEFSKQRALELRQLRFLVSGFAVLGLAILWLKAC